MSGPHLEHLRSGAAAAAVVLAVSSRGDLVVLAVALVALVWRPQALAIVPALLAVAWRWGSTSLEAIAGAQAVLGAAVTVGPTTAAAGMWLAGAAVLLAAPMDPAHAARGGPPPLLAAVAVGATVALVVAGPAPGGDLWQRVAAGVLATVGAVGIGHVRGRARVERSLDIAATVAALAALAVASLDAPGWTGSLDTSAMLDGVVVAVAAVAVVGAGRAAVTAVAAMRHRRP